MRGRSLVAGDETSGLRRVQELRDPPRRESSRLRQLRARDAAVTQVSEQLVTLGQELNLPAPYLLELRAQLRQPTQAAACVVPHAAIVRPVTASVSQSWMYRPKQGHLGPCRRAGRTIRAGRTPTQPTI